MRASQSGCQREEWPDGKASIIFLCRLKNILHRYSKSLSYSIKSTSSTFFQICFPTTNIIYCSLRNTAILAEAIFSYFFLLNLFIYQHIITPFFVMIITVYRSICQQDNNILYLLESKEMCIFRSNCIPRCAVLPEYTLFTVYGQNTM